MVGNVLSPLKITVGHTSTILELESRIMRIVIGRVVLVVQLPQWYCRGDDTLDEKRLATSAEVGVVHTRLMEKATDPGTECVGIASEIEQVVWGRSAVFNMGSGVVFSLYDLCQSAKSGQGQTSVSVVIGFDVRSMGLKSHLHVQPIRLVGRAPPSSPLSPPASAGSCAYAKTIMREFLWGFGSVQGS